MEFWNSVRQYVLPHELFMCNLKRGASTETTCATAAKGLRDRKSPTCTLSQNVYGEHRKAQ